MGRGLDDLDRRGPDRARVPPSPRSYLIPAERGERGPTGGHGQTGDVGLTGPAGPTGERGPKGKLSNVLLGILGTYILIAVTLVLVLNTSNHAIKNAAHISQTRSEQCRVLDADHNRERAKILQDSAEFLGNPRGLDFGEVHYSQAELYRRTKEAYEAPRKTRPPYCDKYHKNPIAPFPSLKDLSR